jgi:uncharacterized protein (TIGR03435 family)
MTRMKFALCALTLLIAAGTAANAQSPEFEVATIKPAAPQTGHFPSPASGSGGPGTADPAMFRCTNCTLAFLIETAFGLERYQFPGRSALSGTSYEVAARLPAGATAEQFQGMLQNLLKDRFALASHFEKKPMQGYELVVGKNGPHLTGAQERPAAPVAMGGEAHGGGGSGNWHGGGNDSARRLSRPGLMVFGGQAKYRGDHQTMTELAKMIATQLAKPVDDGTGLKGFYDITMNWTDDGSHAASHAAGPVGGFGGGEHGGRGGDQADAASGPTLIGAVQQQLGLRLETRKATANIFVVDHVGKTPTDN